MRRTAAVPIVCFTVLLAGCGKSTVKEAGAERTIANLVSSQTGFRPTDVRCPSGVEAKVGVTFSCHFTGPAGKRYTANVQITKIQGTTVTFYVSARPSS